MFLQGVPIREIDWPFLEKCQAERVEESTVLDFKRDGPDVVSSKERSRREFLEDVCGFANGAGGLLLYGVGEHEVEGRKTSRIGEIVGVPLSLSIDDYRQRLRDIVRGGLEPTSSGVEVWPIARPEGNVGPPVIAVGVEASGLAPHRLRQYGSSEFMLRTMTSTIAMDVPLIRHAFLAAEGFREHALRELDAALKRFPWPLPAPFENWSTHSVAVWSAIAPLRGEALSEPARSERIRTILEGAGGKHQHVSDLYTHYDFLGAYLSSYGNTFPFDRIHRSGIVETVEVIDAKPASAQYPGDIDRNGLREALVRNFEFFRKVRTELGITGRAIARVALVGARGMELLKFYSQAGVMGGLISQYTPEKVPIREDPLVVTLETTTDEFGATIKHVADVIWQAAGHQECNGIDEQGKLVEGIR